MVAIITSLANVLLSLSVEFCKINMIHQCVCAEHIKYNKYYHLTRNVVSR